MFNHERTSELIAIVSTIPALFHPNFVVDDAHAEQLWLHVGHSLDISGAEAKEKWEQLVQLHRHMHPELTDEGFYPPLPTSAPGWLEADSALASALAPFLQSQLDFLLVERAV